MRIIIDKIDNGWLVTFYCNEDAGLGTKECYQTFEALSDRLRDLYGGR